MKISTKPLKLALADVGRAIRGRTTQPALSHVKLSITDDDRLLIEATNHDAWVSRKVECAGGIEPILVKHALFSQMIDFVTDETVELLLSGSKLTIKSKSVVVINTMDVKEFPDRPKMTDEMMLALCVEDLAAGLESVHWACDKNENVDMWRQNVAVELKGDCITCLAGRFGMMSFFRRGTICEEKKLSLPGSLVPILLPDLAHVGVDVFVSPNFIEARHGDGSAAIKLSTGTPPPYQQLLDPLKDKAGTMIDREFVRQCCRKAMALAGHTQTGPETPVVSLNRDGEEVTISSSGQHGENSESIQCAGEEEVLANVPGDQLDMALSKMGSDKVKLITLPNAVCVEDGDILFLSAQMRPKTEAQEPAKEAA